MGCSDGWALLRKFPVPIIGGAVINVPHHTASGGMQINIDARAGVYKYVFVFVLVLKYKYSYVVVLVFGF